MEKPTYHTLWELISPARAKIDLATQRPNRHMANRHVDKIKDDLIQGHFYPTHQGIAYDKERKLVDGQHRMEAIVASGVSAWLLVTYGLTEEAIMVIDGGRMRSLADRTTLFLGVTRSKTKLAILRVVITASRGGVRGQNRRQ